MELFIQDFISSNNYDDLKQEDILERRISPYATLRPGDLAALLKLSTLQIPLSSYAHGSGSSSNSQRPSINTIFEKKRTTSTGDSDDEKSEECVDVVCNASDNGHVPTLYVVKNIKQHEIPVIGKSLVCRHSDRIEYCLPLTRAGPLCITHMCFKLL